MKPVSVTGAVGTILACPPPLVIPYGSNTPRSAIFSVSLDTVHLRVPRAEPGGRVAAPKTPGWKKLRNAEGFPWVREGAGLRVAVRYDHLAVAVSLPRLLYGHNLRLPADDEAIDEALIQVEMVLDAAFCRVVPRDLWTVTRLDLCTYLPITVLDLLGILDRARLYRKPWWRPDRRGPRSIGGELERGVAFAAYDKALETYGAGHVSSFTRVEFRLTNGIPKARGLGSVGGWDGGRFAEVFQSYLRRFDLSGCLESPAPRCGAKATLEYRFAAAEVAARFSMAPFASMGLSRPRAKVLEANIKRHVLAMGPPVAFTWAGLLAGAVLDLPDRPPGVTRRGRRGDRLDAGDDSQGPPMAYLLPDLVKDRKAELADAGEGLPGSLPHPPV